MATSAIALAAILLLLPDAGLNSRVRALSQSFECGGIGAECEVLGRKYSALIPKGQGPFPAVLFFHGSSGSGQAVTQSTYLVQPILERGYAIVAPTALEISYRNGPGTGWVWDTSHSEWNDYSFSAKVAEDAVTRFPIDPDRILVAGHSRGGTFAWYLACSNLNLNAFAPIGGTPVRNQAGPCAETRFDSNVLYTHGYTDTVIPFAGSGPEPGWPGYLGAVEVIDGVAGHSGCISVDFVEHVGFDQRTWSGCDRDVSLSVIGFEGGHGIPQGWVDVVLAWFENLPSVGN
ncbi:PHB depolymerase family esterase [Ruegeria sp. 6PALISEP08]|uniref:alpha/beta hydrolase family esterase n=1 Tax=Ruegeria sp. 6PALISEP08 TaxID=1225660 RepID=UPI00155D9190|nr:dienelactone hydrolase family protein [Ruegeria sp. 6PALISEP08]